MANQKLLEVQFGHIAAEEEANALKNYFLETIDYSELLSDPDKILVIGRKGSGKSAIYLAIKHLNLSQQRSIKTDRRMQQYDQLSLVQVLTEYFNVEELRTLIFALGIEFDELPGTGKTAKARELVAFFDRRGQLNLLVEEIRKDRPNVSLLRVDNKRSEKVSESRITWTSQEVLLLVELIDSHFGISHLKEISLKLGVDYENLPPGSKREKSFELVNYMRRRNNLDELYKILQRYNPAASWNSLFEAPSESSRETYEKMDTNQDIEESFEIKESKDAVVEAMTLNDYPWELHKNVKDSGVPLEQTYINSWTYIIWVLLAKKILAFDEPSKFKLVDKLFWKRIVNPNIRFLHRYLKQNYGNLAPSFKEILVDRTRQIRSLKIKDFEVRTESDEDPFQKLSRTISYINRSIQAHVISVLSKQKEYYLLFDQLDLGWDDTDETRQLLIGLILASRNIRRVAKEAGIKLRIILFLRSDIFESLRFEDKNKLGSSLIELSWDKNRLKHLISKRIKASTSGVWEDIFSDEPMGFGKEQFDYILEKTMMRPRDVIQYCVYGKEEAIKLSRDKIDKLSLVAANLPFSNYMRKELQDESRASVPEIDTFLTVLQEIGREKISKGVFLLRCKDKGIDEPDKFLKKLIELSMLGVERASPVSSSKKALFRYQANPWDSLVPTKILFVHPSLHHVLGLSE